MNQKEYEVNTKNTIFAKFPPEFGEAPLPGIRGPEVWNYEEMRIVVFAQPQLIVARCHTANERGAPNALQPYYYYMAQCGGRAHTQREGIRIGRGADCDPPHFSET